MAAVFQMPKVEPVPILTRDFPWWKRTVTWATAKRTWKIAENWTFTLPAPYGVEVTIFAGFVFDFASIPRVFWWIPGFNPTELFLIPSVLHDHGYEKGYLPVIFPDGVRVGKYGYGKPRRWWDQMFLDVSQHVNGLIGPEYVAYGAVRIGGWYPWGKKAHVAEARERNNTLRILRRELAARIEDRSRGDE